MCARSLHADVVVSPKIENDNNNNSNEKLTKIKWKSKAKIRGKKDAKSGNNNIT